MRTAASGTIRGSPSAQARNVISAPHRAHKSQRSSRVQNLSSDVASWQSLRILRMMSSSEASVVTEAPAPPAPASPPPAPTVDISACDIRVGKIIKCEKHPDADSLYVEEIDVGEAEPRTIVSGLVQFVPQEKMQDRKVLVICNLKPRNMRGIKSNGMVLCASNETHDSVEPLDPPAESLPGERVWFGEGNQGQSAPAEPNRVQKKKIWEAVQPLLKTDAQGIAGFKELPMLTAAGPVKVPSLVNAGIS